MLVTEYKEPSQKLGEIGRFRKLLLEISSKLISLPINKVDIEIEKSLKVIGEFWNFDQVVLTESYDHGTKLKTTHSFIAPGIQVSPLSILDDQIPWLMERIRQGETVSLGHLPDDLPPEAKADRDFCEKRNIKSAIVIPFRVAESDRGAFFFISLCEERFWSDELLGNLHYLGEVLASTMERKRASDRMDEIIRFEQLLSEASARYINLPAQELRQGIQKDLGRLGMFLGVDRCIFYLASGEKGRFEIKTPFNWWLEKDHDFVMSLRDWIDSDPVFYDNLQYLFDKWSKGQIVKFTNLDELPEEAKKAKQVFARFRDKSMLSIPISVTGSIVGALVIVDTRTHRIWDEDIIPRLRLLGEIFANALIRMQSDEKLHDAFSEIKDLTKQIEADYVYLREEIKLEHNFDEIIGQGNALKYVLFKIEQVAPTDSTVLILGETGTGKELVARAIHNASKRRDRPLIKVDCTTLTPSLIESELFGHEKGAFTGAESRRIGRFELAKGATIFLDELGELPLELQPKLLRVLQEGTFERVGGSHTIHTDVRIIAASNRNLEKEMEMGRFRSDLWYRLNAFPISVPPLRKRLEDIPLLVSYFVNKYGHKVGKRFDMIPQKTITALSRYPWPGNVRELETIIERAVITSEDGALQIEVPVNFDMNQDDRKTLHEYEREYILKTLGSCNWTIEGLNGAAQWLGLKPSTLRNRMKKLDIRRQST